ncbi:hypothetical protein SMSP2_01467 [Limihaloglobus sulfuriphilus]|uniref:DUF1570 domain-containing protein n=1 Tax=Limihaloglobus sulfuriphilus TaxID=1851148 RepID=A0A1Q2MFR8_9BACT|nr:hypothetical protein [Limihaloglobus sulfuriphilus]AQQ71102.1 hypothetical protein SMSP2_01467 [Limihaloglobus sulfuriphilus]
MCLILTGAVLTGGCRQSGSDVSAAPGKSDWAISETSRRRLISQPRVLSVERWNGDFGIVVSTDHYRVFTTETDPLFLERLPVFLEAVHGAYQDMLGYRLKNPKTLDIYHFASREQWEDFTEQITGSSWPVYKNINRGAYYLNGICVSYNIGRTETLSVLAHEGWHQFSRTYFEYALPSWLDEGLAMQFESFEFENGRYIFNPSRNINRLAALKISLQNYYRGRGGFFTIGELISLNPAQVIIHKNQQLTGSYYASVYALVRFLREHDFGRYRKDFTDMLNDGMLGKWPIDDNAAETLSNKDGSVSSQWNSEFAGKLFERYFDIDGEKLSVDYFNFCNGLTANIRLSR